MCSSGSANSVKSARSGCWTSRRERSVSNSMSTASSTRSPVTSIEECVQNSHRSILDVPIIISQCRTGGVSRGRAASFGMRSSISQRRIARSPRRETPQSQPLPHLQQCRAPVCSRVTCRSVLTLYCTARSSGWVRGKVTPFLYSIYEYIVCILCMSLLVAHLFAFVQTSSHQMISSIQHLKNSWAPGSSDENHEIR